MPISRRTNFIITAPGIVTLCKRLYSTPDESRLQTAEQSAVCSHPAHYDQALVCDILNNLTYSQLFRQVKAVTERPIRTPGPLI